jgi:hypothetical protein
MEVPEIGIIFAKRAHPLKGRRINLYWTNATFLRVLRHQKDAHKKKIGRNENIQPINLLMELF